MRAGRLDDGFDYPGIGVGFPNASKALVCLNFDHHGILGGITGVGVAVRHDQDSARDVSDGHGR